MTSPIHSYLMESGEPKQELSKQYRKDLRERWFFETDELERHKQSTEFSGKLVELQYAEWLEQQGWRIQNLEALGANCDIESASPDGREWKIEVKYIGQEDWDFIDITESLDRNGVGKGRAVSLYAASDFALFKVYTAAKKLVERPPMRLAVLVISDLTWHHFEMPLKNDWMRWRTPQFFNNDEKWNSFLEKQTQRYPNMKTDLGYTLNLLSEIQVLTQRYDFQFSKEHVVTFR